MPAKGLFIGINDYAPTGPGGPDLRGCVNDVRDADDGTTHFSINVIPHTGQHTTLGELEAGRQLNVEVDVLARYIERMLAARSQ